jgi:hypothetical protein
VQNRAVLCELILLAALQVREDVDNEYRELRRVVLLISILMWSYRPERRPGEPATLELALEVKEEPSILSLQPVTSTLLAAPATEYPVRSHTPELVPDRMGSRIAAY